MDNQSGEQEEQAEEDNSSALDDDYADIHPLCPTWAFDDTDDVNPTVLDAETPRAVHERLHVIIKRNKPAEKFDEFTCPAYVALFKACDGKKPDLSKPAEKYFLVHYYSRFIVLCGGKYYTLTYTEEDTTVIDQRRSGPKTKTELTQAFGGLDCIIDGKPKSSLAWFLKHGSIFMRKLTSINSKALPKNALEQLHSHEDKRLYACLNTGERYLLAAALSYTDEELGTRIHGFRKELKEYVDDYQQYQMKTVDNYEAEGTDYAKIATKRIQHRDQPTEAMKQQEANKIYARIMKGALGGGQDGKDRYKALLKASVRLFCFAIVCLSSLSVLIFDCRSFVVPLLAGWLARFADPIHEPTSAKRRAGDYFASPEVEGGC